MRSNHHEQAYGPGVTIERRQVLHLGGLLAAAPLFGHSTRHPFTASRRNTFEAFTTTWRELTDDYLGGDLPLEEAYMYRLAGAVAGIALEDIPPMQRKAFQNERITTGPAYMDGSIFAVVLRMEPGAWVLPHNHPNHVVATTCLEGACRFSNYEMIGGAPAFDDHETAFRIRETRSGVMLPGQTSHLTRARDNMHTFEAGEEGAVLLDFTIERAKNLGMSGGAFGMLEIEEEPLDAFHGTHAAHWIEVEF